MTKKAYEKAISLQKKINKQSWQALQEIVRNNYDLKIDSDNEMYIRIPGEDKADIEIIPSTQGYNFARIQLWYFSELEEIDNQCEISTLPDAVDRIDLILHSVKKYKAVMKSEGKA